MVHDFLKINVPRFFEIHSPRFFGIQCPTIFCDFGLLSRLAQAGGGGAYYMIFHYQKHTVLNYYRPASFFFKVSAQSSRPHPNPYSRVFCSPPRGRTIRSIWTLGLEEDDIADLNLRISNSSAAAICFNFPHCSTFLLLVSAGYRSLFRVVKLTMILSFVFTFISGFVGSPSPF